MGLWYFAPTDDPVFMAGKHEASDEELQGAIRHLEALSGFTTGMRIKSLKAERNRRLSILGGGRP